MNRKRISYAVGFVLLLIVEVLIALYVHDDFVRPYIGDVLVVAVLFCFVRILIPDKIKLMPLYIFMFAAGVEILQYFRLLERLRVQDHTFFGILVGSVFDIKDIICYGIGCAAIAVISTAVRKVKL